MTKAIILTLPRSGSEVLVECLDSHPDIKCESEVILPYIGDHDMGVVKMKEFFEKEIVENEKRMSKRKIICFKAMYMHLGDKAWSYIKREKVMVVHLIRKNQFERAVSDEFNHRKQETGRSHHSKEREKVVRLKIDRDKLLGQMKEYRQLVVEMKRFLKNENLGYTTVYYEEMFGQSRKGQIEVLPEKIAKRICTYFGIPLRPMSTTLIKQNHRSLAECVENWDEIKSLNNFFKRRQFLV